LVGSGPIDPGRILSDQSALPANTGSWLVSGTSRVAAQPGSSGPQKFVPPSPPHPSRWKGVLATHDLLSGTHGGGLDLLQADQLGGREGRVCDDAPPSQDCCDDEPGVMLSPLLTGLTSQIEHGLIPLRCQNGFRKDHDSSPFGFRTPYGSVSSSLPRPGRHGAKIHLFT